LITVADVSGHDPGASLLMANTRAYLRALAQESHDPAVILTRLNHFVTHDVDGRRFVTMFIARIDPDQSVFHWASAGHAAQVFRADGFTEELNAATIPIGVDLEKFHPMSATCELLPGELMLISTDGLAETRSRVDEEFGNNRIANVIRDNATQSTDELLKSLQSAVGDHRGTFQLTDDETIVLIRFRGVRSKR
jgi:sigma-B regulation protein RsbU (phosphoserine phosphatase)